MFALLWYSKIKNQEIKGKTAGFIPLKNIYKILKTITKTDFAIASQQLNHSPEEIKRVIELLI